MKINKKLIDSICKQNGWVNVLCIKNTRGNLEEKKRVISILKASGYDLKFNNIDIYLDEEGEEKYIALQAGEDKFAYAKEDKILINYVSNSSMFQYIEDSTLTLPVNDYGYTFYSCDSIEDLLIKDEEIE